jgi:hypothetical protein
MQWRQPCDPSGVTFRDATGRTGVSEALFRADPRVAVILALGASNLANEGDAKEPCEPAHGVFNFDFIAVKCYVAKDPLVGSTADRGNVLTRLGDRLVSRGRYDRVLLVPVAHGGTLIGEWVPGGRMHPRLRRAIETLSRAGIAVTHILWQLGEGEISHPRNEDDVKGWIAKFARIADVIRAARIDAPIYVAQATICCSGRSEAMRGAQRAVVQSDRGILAGPDLDVLGPDQRWDGCHFSVSGMERAADLWFDALAAAADGKPQT